jgi:hypothetical protein
MNNWVRFQITAKLDVVLTSDWVYTDEHINFTWFNLRMWLDFDYKEVRIDAGLLGFNIEIEYDFEGEHTNV